MKPNIKRLVVISVLISLSIVFSWLDTVISNVALVGLRYIFPSLKLGLANIVIMVFISRFKFYEGLIACTLKSIVVALLFSGMTGFIIGYSGTLFSFIIMSLLRKTLKGDKMTPFISIVGSVAHTLGQIIVGFLIYSIEIGKGFLIYVPLLIIMSIIVGLIVGYISKMAIKLLDTHNFTQIN